MELPTTERASHNYYRVMRSIWRSDGISRTDLATIHKLDKTTISQIVGALTDEGLVRVVDLDTSMQGPGRKSELLKVDDAWGTVVGIDIRPDGVNVVATDMHGRVIAAHHHRQVTERTLLRDVFHRSIESLRADDRVQGRPIVGAGVGVSGIVDAGGQRIVRSIPLNILDPYDFNWEIARHSAIPVIVDNDANCCAWGELVRAEQSNTRDFLYVLIEFRRPPNRHMYGGDIGMGLGLVLDGSVYYGATGAAGEFRSIYWHPGYSNQFAIPDSEAQKVLDHPEVLPRLIEEMAAHVGLFANVLDLEVVYVGGDIAPISDFIVGSFQTAIQNNWPYDEEKGCRVELSRVDSDIVAVGAAAMVLERMFREPLLQTEIGERNATWRAIFAAKNQFQPEGFEK